METKQTFNDWTLDLEECAEVDGFFDRCFYKWVKKNILSAGRFAKKRKQLENVLLGEMDSPYDDMRGVVEDWFYSLPVSIDDSLPEDKKEEILMDFVEENFKKVPLNITREVKDILWDWVKEHKEMKESRRPTGRMLREDFLDPDDEDEDLRHDDEQGYDYEFDFDGARDSIRTASEAVKRVRRIFWDGEPEAAPESETAELYEKLTELRDAVEELINVVEP